MTSDTTTDIATDLESALDAELREKELTGHPRPLSPAECGQVSGAAFATDSPLY